MGIDAGRYRERRRKTLTMPSGDVATIRKPGRDSYMKLLDAQDLRDQLPQIEQNIDPTTGEFKTLTPERQKLVESMMDIMDEVLVKCVIEPKVSITPTEEALAVDELDLMDYFFLIQEVFVLADMSEEKIQSLFRPSGKPVGEDGGGNSVVSQPKAESDSPAGTPIG
jgi:hypothetical protein